MRPIGAEMQISRGPVHEDLRGAAFSEKAPRQSASARTVRPVPSKITSLVLREGARMEQNFQLRVMGEK
jgi:hypothetical protein